MEEQQRNELEGLAARLGAHEGERADVAKSLGGDVRAAIDADDHEGLGERLAEEAVHFEAAHPELADILRRAASLLGGAGM